MTLHSPTPDEVRAHRASLGLTQPAYGSLLGYSVRIVQSWESGVRTMPGPVWLLYRALSVPRVRRMLRALGLWDSELSIRRHETAP